MNDQHLALLLATRLTGPWSVQDITQSLCRHLPAPLHTQAEAISQKLLRIHPGPYAPPIKQIARTLRNADEFPRIKAHCVRYNVWPAANLTPPQMMPIGALASLDLPQIPTLEDLADWLLIPTDQLNYLADPQKRHEAHNEMAVNHYHYHIHPKSNGASRLIEAPKQRLKAAQAQILRGILAHVPDHDEAFGFTKGRNCMSGATRHVGEQVVVGFDVKNFFPSIGAGRIFGLFRCLGYPESVARFLTAICTNVTPSRILNRLQAPERQQFRHPHLPQGAPTSPALSNKVAFTLDRRLSGLATRLGANYSRYADDISFSGDVGITHPLLQQVPRILRNEGFAPNPAKTRVMPRGGRQSVTGIVVNQHLNISREKFDHLKAVIHACRLPTDLRLDDLAFRMKLEGQITWIECINPVRGCKLRRLLKKSLKARIAETTKTGRAL
ncbi:Reverse transcriptase (RNA-dependent DNA polymerase) [Aliiroseovarius halocynthiae]|nr:reverse transcriptase family protein [Aliiroseovarius halocynthiae]SMR72165.1 Reverse transcriptase (RNA-dependent DNA polymerase) [Aliiroseovarius halocynthiae]